MVSERAENPRQRRSERCRGVHMSIGAKLEGDSKLSMKILKLNNLNEKWVIVYRRMKTIPATPLNSVIHLASI